MNRPDQTKRLVRIEVKGLLNSFEHTITFPADHEFVCVHGPNGIGKTRLLEIVQAALSGHGAALHETPFQELSLTFADSTSMTVKREDELSGDSTLSWSLGDENGPRSSPSSVDSAAFEHAGRWLLREGYIRKRPAFPGMRLLDAATGDEISERDAVARYMHILPDELAVIPPEIRQVVQLTPTRLIEVGRLREVIDPSVRSHEGRREGRIPAVKSCAQDLADRIRSVRALYSIAAQRIDRSYANRLISNASDTKLKSDSTIRADFIRLRDHQDTLARLTLLEPQTGGLSLPASEMKRWQRQAIGLHLDDSFDKLKTFDTMASRMQLLLSIVNDKFSHKKLDLDAREGFVLRSEGVDPKEIPAEQLSSGEQHLIVMTYRLLFDATPGELVLIDEPEVSLHVAWQRQFLDDLKEIATLQGLRFIVATHSPQIVGKWTDRLAALGSVD